MSWSDDIPPVPAIPRPSTPVQIKPAPKCVICKERRTYRTIFGHAVCSYCEAAGLADEYKRRW